MKNYNFEKLEPKAILTWFKKICSIPHGSWHEAELADMLKHELNKAGCFVKQFSSGAIYATKKASKGLEKRPTVLLQAHMDMVLTKAKVVKMDMIKEPIKPYYDTTDGYIKCDGTTLGADDGIGVAAIMELMTNDSYQHGPLEVLLSVTEEVDIQNCMNSIPPKQYKAKHLINLDIDSPIRYYVGSNGASTFECSKNLQLKPVHKQTKTYEVELSAFDGGHSALVIHNPLNNAIIAGSEMIYSFMQEHSKVSLISINGGNAANAIPRYATFTIQASPKDIETLKDHIDYLLKVYKVFAQGLDKEAKCQIRLSKQQAKKACDYDETEKILKFFIYVPNGIDRMDITMKHIFSTNNVGVVETKDDNLVVTAMARAFTPECIEYITSKIRYLGTTLGFGNFKIRQTADSWLTQHPENVEIAKLWVKNYHKVTRQYTFPEKDPGGLELSAIIKNSPQLQDHAIAVGPKMYDCHSPNERVEVKSIQDFWKTLLLVLKEIK